ncbi:hypothetical protein GCM10008957_52670 [Deinococcus ruber]|uniref:Uncharacterized protein n=1 Tax=Deinococcus ruber TaxID=1848197 RepID=A0A918FGL3_9DEIO|nr:hypothetical protein GCM10008957_52670 [Deinococcus ruber]
MTLNVPNTAPGSHGQLGEMLHDHGQTVDRRVQFTHSHRDGIRFKASFGTAARVGDQRLFEEFNHEKDGRFHAAILEKSACAASSHRHATPTRWPLSRSFVLPQVQRRAASATAVIR